MDEVRYHMLRPAQVVERRKACPIAYVPLGNLEWHGVQNPLGADTLQAESFAIRCAQKGGGLALPPLYYGENRLANLVEATSPDKELIAEQMDLPADNFLSDKMPFSEMEQAINYLKLLLHILAEVESLGFEVGILVAGHYPLIDHARAAVLEYSKRTGERKMIAWAFVDYLLVRNKYPASGDHGGKWETSHMMATHPETVDLRLLKPKGQKLVGTSWKDPSAPQDSTASFGQEIIEAAVDIAIQETRDRLQNPHRYTGHGCCLEEGLWRQPKK